MGRLVVLLLVVVFGGLLGWEQVRQANDRTRSPRRGFGAILWSSTGHRVDTIRQTATKDLVNNPDTTISFHPSDRELDDLYARAIRDRLFELPEPHPASTRRMIQPAFDAGLELHAGEVRRRFEWDSNDVPLGSSLETWSRLYGFTKALDALATHQPAYQALPRPQGFYL